MFFNQKYPKNLESRFDIKFILDGVSVKMLIKNLTPFIKLYPFLRERRIDEATLMVSTLVGVGELFDKEKFLLFVAGYFEILKKIKPNQSLSSSMLVDLLIDSKTISSEYKTFMNKQMEIGFKALKPAVDDLNKQFYNLK